MGDINHGEDGTHYGFYNWINPTQVTAESGETVADILTNVLDENNFTYNLSNGYLSSITSPGGCELGEFVNGGMSGWMYAVNGSVPMVGAAQYTPQDGDEIIWFYIDNYMNDSRCYGVGLEPEISINNLEAQWDTYHANNGVLYNSTADVEETQENFTYQLKLSSEWIKGVSDPLIVDGNIYVAVGDLLYVLDSTGEPVNGTALEGSIGYTSRLVYDDGIIVVPFVKGGLQALSAETLETLWVTGDVTLTEDSPANQQALTTLTYDDGFIYFGTACAGVSSTTSGVYRCVELLTGTTVWQHTNESSGYYWSGAAVKGNAVVFVGDDGIINSLNKKTGEVIDRLETGLNGSRSTVVIDGSTLYFTSRDGYIVSADISQDGTLGNLRTANFANTSTCTPTIAGDTIVVGGAAANYSGVLAEINKNTLEVINTVPAVADVKSAPVVDVVSDKSYVFYTANKTPGSLYMHQLGTDEAEEIYLPSSSAQNYCMASPVMDSKGHIYYTNDSGYLFSVSFVPNQEESLMGDVNGDGKISTLDAVLIQRYILEYEQLTEQQLACADLNSDGRISVADVVLVLRAVLNQ